MTHLRDSYIYSCVLFIFFMQHNMILNVFLEDTFPFIILRKTIIAFEIQIFAAMSASLIEFFLHM